MEGISRTLAGSEQRGGRAAQGRGGPDPQVTCRGVSSISIRNVSMGVSPISLKKKRCSRHFSPMDRSAGRRRRSLANLEESGVRGTGEAPATLSRVFPSLCQGLSRAEPKFSPKTPRGGLCLRFPCAFKISFSLRMCEGNIYLLKIELSLFKT